MKFLHNILHTYSFILGIIKHNWKIRQFWVADLLNLVIFVHVIFINFTYLIKNSGLEINEIFFHLCVYFSLPHYLKC